MEYKGDILQKETAESWTNNKMAKRAVWTKAAGLFLVSEQNILIFMLISTLFPVLFSYFCESVFSYTTVLFHVAASS